MGFLENKNINLLNLHAGLVAFGDNVIYIFGAIYFLQQGLSLPIVLLIWAAVHTARLVVRPLALKLIQAIGIKKGLIIGTLLYPGIFAIIAQVESLGFWLLAFIVYFAIIDNLYWLPYHVFFTTLGDNEHRGKQLGARESFITLMAAAAPILGGFLADRFGFGAIYFVTIFVMILAIFPLLFTPNIPKDIKLNYSQAFKKTDHHGFWVYAGWSLLYTAHEFLWIIVLFILVGEISIFGWLMGMELLLMIVFSLLLGHLTDKGKGWINILIAGVLLTIVIIARSFFISDILAIIIFEVVMALALCFFNVPTETGYYNLAQKSRSRLWFQTFGETGWDVGGLVALLSAAALVYSGVELRHVMPIALIGMLVIIFVLKEYFTGSKKLSNQKEAKS
ncbi:MFS transporter [Patescibacteria group bacterium]|nr:MFS transporter [Patescibacteria group bacterium]